MKRDIELLISLKKSKKDGSLDVLDDPEAQVHKWRKTLDYKTLEHWLTGDNEEVRKLKNHLLVKLFVLYKLFSFSFVFTLWSCLQYLRKAL